MTWQVIHVPDFREAKAIAAMQTSAGWRLTWSAVSWWIKALKVVGSAKAK